MRKLKTSLFTILLLTIGTSLFFFGCANPAGPDTSFGSSTDKEEQQKVEFKITSNTSFLVIGQEAELTVGYTDGTAVKEITWTNDNPEVIEMPADIKTNKIIIKGKSNGTANITATETETGKSDKYIVKVIDAYINVTKNGTAVTNVTMNYGDTVTLKYEIKSKDSARSIPDVTMTTDGDTNFFTVNKSADTITVTAKDDGASQHTLKINLSANISSSVTAKSEEIIITSNKKPEPPAPQPGEGGIDLSDPKNLILVRTTKRNQWNQIEDTLGDYEYSKPGVKFDRNEYRLLIAPNESIDLYLKNEKGETEQNVQWFVDSRIFPTTNTTALNLFSEDESQVEKGTAPDSSPLIINKKGDGGVSIKGTSRFDKDGYDPSGYIVAVVDEKYVHKKPFYVLKAKDVENRKKHETTEDAVKQVSTPLMNYGPVETAFLINKTVCQHLEYKDNYLAKPDDYSTFVEKGAVCDGYARMCERLGMELGLDVTYISGKSYDDETLHAWNTVKLDDGLYYFDSTWNDPSGTGKSISYSLPDPMYNINYFFMDKDTFECDHHKPIEGTFGTKYLNTDNAYKNKYDTWYSEGIQSPVSNKIAIPDLSKVSFVGTSTSEGILKTTESDIEYNTGDGVWHSLTSGQEAKVSNISVINKSCFNPTSYSSASNSNFIGNPHAILLRRHNGNGGYSDYVKVSVYTRSKGPDWITVDDTGLVKYVNTNMEYSSDNGTSYTPVLDNEFRPGPGTYKFRMKGDKNYLASDDFEVTVNK